MRKVTQRCLRDTGFECENLWEGSSLEDAGLVLFLEERLEGPPRRVNPTSCFSEMDSGSVFSTSTFEVPEQINVITYFQLFRVVRHLFNYLIKENEHLQKNSS